MLSRRLSPHNWYKDPQQPFLSSYDPNISFETLELIIAPAHIGHGSFVTYIVQSFKRQSPIVLAAAVIAMISA